MGPDEEPQPTPEQSSRRITKEMYICDLVISSFNSCPFSGTLFTCPGKKWLRDFSKAGKLETVVIVPPPSKT